MEPVKQSLSLLSDSQAVDRLNAISSDYILSGNKDSARHYARLALNHARRIPYNHGIAKSYLYQSQLVKHFENDFAKAESLAKASLVWFDRSVNKDGIHLVYSLLVSATAAQSKYLEAVKYSEKYYEWALHSHSFLNVLTALQWSIQIYFQNGEFEKCFALAQQSYALSLQSGNKRTLYYTFLILAKLYLVIEDYASALTYYRQAFLMEDKAIREYRDQTDADIWIKMQFAETFSHLGQFDSAWHYYRLFKPPADRAVYLRVYWVSTGTCYFQQKDYRKALQHFQAGLAGHRRLNDRNEMMRTLLFIGKTQLALANPVEALRYAREGLEIAVQTNARHAIRDAYEILFSVFDQLHQPDSANFYYRQFAAVKESVLSAQTRGKLAAYKYEQKLALMDREKAAQQAKITHERFVKKLLLGGMALLLALGAVLLRNSHLKGLHQTQKLEHRLAVQRWENEKTRTNLQQQAVELEIQALRAQMNPHFIFNSLNSINHFILKNDKRQASSYLIKFSRLIRLILQNSQADLISLEDELEALVLYLELEALRFDHQFAFQVQTEKDMDVSSLKVPPLIVQPIVENAIWHGLEHKKQKGRVDIRVTMEKNFLLVTVSDNGVGRKQAGLFKNQSAASHRSMGLDITLRRIAMLQAPNSPETPVTINDLVAPDGTPAGTEVVIKMPVMYG